MQALILYTWLPPTHTTHTPHTHRLEAIRVLQQVRGHPSWVSKPTLPKQQQQQALILYNLAVLMAEDWAGGGASSVVVDAAKDALQVYAW